VNAATPQRSTLTVELAERSYDIVVGDGLLAEADRFIAPILARPFTVVISDETVAALHLDSLRTGLNMAGIDVAAITVPAGETTKNMAELERLLDRLLDLQVGRRDMVIALGGGVVGDLVGFAAAILRRGTDFIQIPTTLLAQVDSSVGGKTAVNARQGKNLIGAFHQPRLVLADVGVLDTLPAREMKAGYAEVVKYGLLGDTAFFEWLERHGADVLAGNREALRHAVVTSCRAKADIVTQDERENGLRALLNLGHTFAHAYEAEAKYGGDVLHGEAVAVGMIQALTLSHRLGHCPGQDLERARRHFLTVGLPTSPADLGLGDTAPAELIAHMYQDKKVDAGRLTFILARGIGEAFVSREVEEADVLAVLAGEA
jgi:3-dehydroquinate synthase